MNRGAWWATIHGVTKSWTWLSNSATTIYIYILQVMYYWIHVHTRLNQQSLTARVLLYFSLYTHTHKYCCCCSLTKSCPTLCDLMDCSPPWSSVHVVLQARILEWIAVSFFRGSPDPGIKLVSCIGKWILYHGATKKVHTHICIHNICHKHLPYMLCIKYTYSCHIQNIYTYICVNVSLEVFEGQDSLFILVSQYLTLWMTYK